MAVPMKEAWVVLGVPDSTAANRPPADAFRGSRFTSCESRATGGEPDKDENR